MKLSKVTICMLYLGALQAHAHAAPVPGQDYQSVQIASGTKVEALRTLYARYIALPFLRLEKRGSLYVLRFGFWDTRASARAALAQLAAPKGLLRAAVLRPESLVQRNWTDTAVAPVLVDTATPPIKHPLQARPTPVPLASSDILRAFEPQDFALAYQVLLATGDLRRAFQIAQQAVAAVPKDRSWHRKLAQVAEWTQRPDIAAAQWNTLFQQGDREQDTLDNVVRLSAQLADPGVALQVWQIRAQRMPLDAAQWQEVLRLFEEMAQANEGSRFFEAQYQSTDNVTLIEYAARLAENAGDDKRALRLYLKRSGLAPFSLDAVMRAVLLLVRSERLPEALQVLQTHTAQVPADAANFWRLLGQVAWDLHQTDVAQRAYQQYVQTPQAVVADWSRLIFLVRSKYPAQAASLALDAYHRFGNQEQLALALEIYASLDDTPAQRRIYESLQGPALQQAEKQLRFLLLRAQFYQRSRQPDSAWADLRLALQLAPQDRDAVLTALWFSIDQGRSKTLAELLPRYASAASDPSYWLAYAAGHQMLGRPREALRWYAKAVQRTPQDALLLLNYADVLEQVQQVGMAARIRRHAWLTLKSKISASPSSAPASLTAATRSELLAQARLAILNRPGDPALQQVRLLVQKMRGQPSEQTDAQTNALVLGWAVAQEQFVNARSWMWLRYARQSQESAPLWGASQVALQLGDTLTMDRLLTDSSDGMPIYNRYDTAYALGYSERALDTAFQGLTQNSGDEALHDRFRQHAPNHAAYVQVRLMQEGLGSLGRSGLQSEVRWPVNGQLNLLASWSRLGQSSSDPGLKDLAPGVDQWESLEGQWQSARGQGSLALFHRVELESYIGMSLKQTYRWNERIQLDAGLEYRGESAMSLPLQVAGYEHNATGSLSYNLDKRVYVRASPKLSQYYTQLGDYLGSGSTWDLEAGYRLRTQYPDWRLRATFSQQDLSRTTRISADSLSKLPPAWQALVVNGAINLPNFFVPDSSRSFGLCAGMGENIGGQNLRTVYSKALRPYFDVCLQDNSKAGSGYTALAGLAGSLAGADHVSVEFQKSDGLSTTDGSTQKLTLRYRYYF